MVLPGELKAMLRDGKELALIDVREQGVFYKEHQLFAVCIPLSHLEVRIRDMVPRYATRMVLVDEGPGEDLARRASRQLTRMGYRNVAVLRGGIRAWDEAGYELFSGVNVPSKAFGEICEETCNTPRITAEALKAKFDSGDTVVVLDSRPWEEYQLMSIPGSIDTPGAELVLRVHDLAPDPETFVVVNCAGRTRSIIGTQSLINAGIVNPVAALKNGTMGWHLTGFELERGMERRAPEPSPEGLQKARACARRVAEHYGVQTIDHDTLAAWSGEENDRTVYVFDVRLPEEYEQGHLACARNAPGGQLVQATDEYAAVRHARIVLVDSVEVQAVMTASWLIQMGWTEVYVLAGGLGDEATVTGAFPATMVDDEWNEIITPADLVHAIDGGIVTVIDLGSSRNHTQGHIPGASWCVRSRVHDHLQAIGQSEFFVFTSEDGRLANLAARDMKEYRPDISVKVLDGGTDAWVQDGLPVEMGMQQPLCEVDDIWYKPYEQSRARERDMHAYLTWEVALVEKVRRDGDASFRKGMQNFFNHLK